MVCVWADSSDIHIQGEKSWGKSHETNETLSSEGGGTDSLVMSIVNLHTYMQRKKG